MQLKYYDKANHGDIDVFDAINDWGLPFEEGRVVQYVARAACSDTPKFDKEKALFYIHRAIVNAAAEQLLNEQSTQSSSVKTEHVNHPDHYNMGTIEVITAITEWRLNFNLGNVVKYVARSKHKGSRLEDLKKAKWYLEYDLKEDK